MSTATSIQPQQSFYERLREWFLALRELRADKIAKRQALKQMHKAKQEVSLPRRVGGALKRGALWVGRAIMRGAGYLGLGFVSVGRAIWWGAGQLVSLAVLILGTVFGGLVALIVLTGGLVLWLAAGLFRGVSFAMLYLHDLTAYLAQGRPGRSFKLYRAGKQQERLEAQLVLEDERDQWLSRFAEDLAARFEDLSVEQQPVVPGEVVASEEVPQWTVDGALDMTNFPALENPKGYDWAQHLDDPFITEAYDFFAARAQVAGDVKEYSYWTARSYARATVPTTGWKVSKVHGAWLGTIDENTVDARAGYAGVRDEISLLDSIKDQVTALIAQREKSQKS